MEEEPKKKESFIQKTARRSQFLNHAAMIILVVALVMAVIKHF